jgi:hypothetical protein
MTRQIQKSDPVSNCKRTFDHPSSAISDPCRLEPGEAAALDLLAGRLLTGITTDRASAQAARADVACPHPRCQRRHRPLTCSYPCAALRIRASRSR